MATYNFKQAISHELLEVSIFCVDVFKFIINPISYSENLSKCSCEPVNSQDDMLLKNEFFGLHKVE